MSHMGTTSTSDGFTLIEVIITVVLAAIVFVGLFSSLASIFAINEGSSQRTTASNLAYANLRLYADGNPPTWFACNTSDETAPATLLDKSESVAGLPGTAHQVVTATAVYGCDGTSQGYPIKVESSVELTNGRKVTHATYASF